MARRFALAMLVVAVHAAAGAQQISDGYVPTHDGTRLYYQKAGSAARTIIASGRLFLFENLRALADSFTVIAYDMRNRGWSDPIDDSTKVGIHDDVRDLETVRRHFNVERANLIGYSYLGFMVMLYAREHPQRIERIVQLGPVPMRWDTEYPNWRINRVPSEAETEALIRRDRLRIPGASSDQRELCEASWAVERFGLVGDPTHVDRLGASRCDMPNEWPARLQRHFRLSFKSIQQLNHSWSDFAVVTAPVLTIHGTLDRNAPYGAGVEWATRLPNARLLTMTGAAHQAISEYPDVVIPAMRTFFGGAWPPEAKVVTPPPNARSQ